MRDAQGTPSTAPAGVPPSGNGKYIAIVALLLVGMGVAVAFKTCGPKPLASITPPLSTFDASPISHREDFVPPPPPPDEVLPEAGATVRQTTAFDPCSAKSCSGTATSELETAIGYRAKQAHRCYDAALAQDNDLKGRVSLRVRVASNGAVCNADVRSNDMGTDSVARCVAQIFRGSRSFPAPKGNCVDLDVPLSFVPGGGH